MVFVNASDILASNKLCYISERRWTDGVEYSSDKFLQFNCGFW